jgi:hypothetical protein
MARHRSDSRDRKQPSVASTSPAIRRISFSDSSSHKSRIHLRRPTCRSSSFACNAADHRPRCPPSDRNLDGSMT